MIGGVRHKALRRFFDTGDARGLPADMVPRLRRMLSALNAADDLEKLRTVPGWRLHALKGGLQDYWSLSVSGNWRLTFKWEDGTANDLDLVDYH
jgi:proteic killer suppression protein